MRKIVIALLLIAGQCLAQDLDWARFYPLPNRYRGTFYDVFRTTDEGFALCGRGDTSGVGILLGGGFWLVKTDREGEMEFEHLYQPGSWIHAHAYSVIQCGDGGYLVGGHANDTIAGDRIRILRTDPDGEQIWLMTKDQLSECYAVIEAKGGGYLACGRLSPNLGYIIHLDDNANIIWERSFSGEIANLFNTIREVDGGFLLGGWGSVGFMSAKLVKINEQGEVIWHRAYNFPQIYA